MVVQDSGKPVIAAFDFDVTMTTKDTFVPFLYRAFGKNRVRLVLLKLALDGLMVLARLSDRDKFKEKIVRTLFLGESIETLSELGRQHAEEIYGWIRPGVKEHLEWHRNSGHRLIMVSASLNLYLEHIAKRLGFNNLLCTTLSVNHLVFDGALSGYNCRGPEKVARLEELLGDLRKYEIYAYGDSAGDKEMLDVADHPHYRFFED